MVAAVDERHLDRRAGQGLGRRQAGEAAADDEDPGEWLRAAHTATVAPGRRSSRRTSARSATTACAPCARSARRVLGGADPDDEAEATGPPGLDAGRRVLEYGGPRGWHAEAAGGLQEHVGGGLAREAEALEVDAVDPHLEERRQACGAQDRRAIPAGRGDRRPHPPGPGLADETHRRVEHLHALPGDEPEEVSIPSLAQPDDRLAGLLDAARGQEASHACPPGLAVDVPAVIRGQVEGDEPLAGARRAGGQVLVEELLPGARVDRGRPRDHPVEVEDEGVEAPEIDDDHRVIIPPPRGRRFPLRPCPPAADDDTRPR